MSDDSDSSPRESPDEERIGYRSSFVWVRRLWPVTRPHLRYVAVILTFALLGAPLAVVSPWIVKRLIDEAAVAEGIDDLWPWALALILMTALSVVFGLAGGYATHLFHNKIAYVLRLRLFRHLQRLSLRYHQARETGYLMSRLDHDVANLDGIMADALGRTALEGLKAVAFLVMLFILEPRLAAAGCVVVVVVFGVQYLVSRPLRLRNRALQEARSSLTEALHQNLSGHDLVRATASETREARRYASFLARMVRASVRRDLFALWSNHVMFLITGVAPTLIILAGTFLIAEGSFTVGGLFAFFMFLVQMSDSVGMVARHNPAMQASAASAQRVFEILDAEPEIREPADPVPLERIAGDVRFESVGFAYERERPVLREITFHAPPGTKVALVGPSGAGKTTLVTLIPRFHDPGEGRILLDGVDLRRLSLKTLRRAVGVVPQEVFLFDRTVRENIAFGAPDASLEEIRAAAAAAHALEFIEELPRGFDTEIGERGVRLSGGQRQRLAIAREILRDPAVLILDEATSSLDTESERLIQEALERLLKDRTSFIIAHRLSTVLTADIILVMDRGRIVERGRHLELMAGNGVYARLCRAQAFVGPDAGDGGATP